MRFTIIATKQGHQPPQGSCDFMPPGGTIGRGADNNLVLPDEDRTISRLQAIVHITADGECRITNRGNVTLVHLNDIPLERGRQVDLQDGDILSIDEYRLQVSDLTLSARPEAAAWSAASTATSQVGHSGTAPQSAPSQAGHANAAHQSAASQSGQANAAPQSANSAQQPASSQSAAKENTAAAIPSEIWDSLAQEFSISDSLSSRSRPQQSNLNPLTEAPAIDRNPVDPLAQFAAQPDSLNLDRRDQTPDSLFNDDPLFRQNSIFEDNTPSTLMQQPSSSGKSGKGREAQDPLTLFGGNESRAPAQSGSDDPLAMFGNNRSGDPAQPGSDDPLALFGNNGGAVSGQSNSDDPLGLMMGNAVPLTPPDDSSSQPRPATKQPPQQTIVPPAPKALDSDFDLFMDEDSGAASSLSDEQSKQANDRHNSTLSDRQQQNPGSHNASLFDEPAQQNPGDHNSSLFDDMPQDLSASPLFAPQHEESSDAALTPPASPLFDNQPAESAGSQPDYGGITLPTPQAVTRTNMPPPKGRLRIDPVSNTASQHANASGDGQMLDGELLEALMGGMGLNDLQPTPRIDRDSMQELGQMLSMFSQGTVALLSSRSILKRGVKAEMTVILDEANNPFKLLPSGKSVLMQMFGSRMPGFMPPRQSVRDALVDLQAHQLGMIAGIRAIIASMLQSFNPQQLEEEAKREGVTSRLSLPSSRKAALWEHFTKRYGETAGEIEDDFHTLFGEAFLHAYDMEVNQYKDSQIRSEE